MIKLRAIGRCLFFLQSCRTSNYVRSVAMSWFQSDLCVMERLQKKILFKLSVRVEVSSVESNETTAATVSCDLAPPPQRRRRRHPQPPPPRNFPFVTLPLYSVWWLGSRVVSVLDSGVERPGFKSVTALGKLFTPIVPLFTKQRN